MEITTYFEAKKFTNTVALLDRASNASLWIEVFGGKTPFANREIIVRGSARSYSDVSELDFHRDLGPGTAITNLNTCSFAGSSRRSSR